MVHTFNQLANYTREQWLILKATSVSSTESAALFGMSPYLTAYELGVMKSSKEPELTTDTPRMSWGRRLQDAIAQGIADDNGVVIEGLEYQYAVHPKLPRMGSSFDYAIVDANHGEPSLMVDLFTKHGPGLLEIKNVDWLVYKDWPENEAPDHIEIQVQHQLEVADREWCILGVLVGGNRTELYVRMRDREVGAAIVKRVGDFWAALDKGVLPPAVLPQDADIIIKMNQYADPGKVLDAQEDTVLASLCDEYTSAGEVARRALEAQRSLKAKIFQTIGSAERALLHGYKLSAAMRAPSDVKAHTRAGYRDLRITKVEEKNDRS